MERHAERSNDTVVSLSLTEAEGAAEANLQRTWTTDVPRTFPYPCEVPSDSETCATPGDPR